jgi:hypothetical protein
MNGHMNGSSEVMINSKENFVVYGEDLLVNVLKLSITLSTA